MEGGELDAEVVQEGTDSLGVLYSPGDRQEELQRVLRALHPYLQTEFPVDRGRVSALCVAELQGGKTGRFVLCGHEKEAVIPEAVSS